MTNMEKLREIYREKEAAGLVHVGLNFSENAGSATAEQLAGEVLAMEEAIRAGKVTPLDFGDSTLTEDQKADICRHIEAARTAPPEAPDASIRVAFALAATEMIAALRSR